MKRRVPKALRPERKDTGGRSPHRKPEPRAFIFGEWVRADRVLAAIEAQEQFERVAALRQSKSPIESVAEEQALARVTEGAHQERNACLRACYAHERFAFEQFRGTGPALRETIKAVLTDRAFAPGTLALAARPMGRA